MKYLTPWWKRFFLGIEVENAARSEKWLDDLEKARAAGELPPPPPDRLITKGM
jgi:hypothetical protein